MRSLKEKGEIDITVLLAIYRKLGGLGKEVARLLVEVAVIRMDQGKIQGIAVQTLSTRKLCKSITL
jgi:hypothetical protein